MNFATVLIIFPKSHLPFFTQLQEYRQRQKAARDSQVVMYRKYRVGELPDIQIKHSELIRPFQALAQVSTSMQHIILHSINIIYAYC